MQNKKKKDTKLPRKSTYILYSLKKELSSVLFPYDVQIAKSFFPVYFIWPQQTWRQLDDAERLGIVTHQIRLQLKMGSWLTAAEFDVSYKT